MTMIASSPSPQFLLKKHDRSDAVRHARRLQPTGERPAWLGDRQISSAVAASAGADLGWLAGLRDPAVFDGLDRPWWRLVLPAFGTVVATWQRRMRSRQDLAAIDARTLRDAGISPGAAAFEAAQHFWQAPIELRDYPGDKSPA